MTDSDKPDVAMNQRELQPSSPQTPEQVTGIAESEHSLGGGSGVAYSRDQDNQRPNTLSGIKKLRDDVLKYWMPLVVSMLALVFSILSFAWSYKALQAASLANRWAYYTYSLTLIADRLSLMQLCAMNVTIYASTCEKLDTWDYLPAVYDTLLPGGGEKSNLPSDNKPPAQDNVTLPEVVGIVVATVGGSIAAIGLAAGAYKYFSGRNRKGI